MKVPYHRSCALVILVLMALAVGACDRIGGEGIDKEPTSNRFIQRYTDDKYRVVCWEATYALSCLPESQLVLR